MSTFGLPYTTVAEARALFGTKFFGSDSSSPEFYAALNEVGQTFYSQGTWRGAQARFTMDLPEDKILVLPYHLEAVKGIRVNQSPRLLVAVSHEFLASGPGDMTALDTKLVIRETYSVTPVSWPAGKTGHLVLTGAGSEQVRVFGLNAMGAEVIDSLGLPGETVTVGGAASTNVFSMLTGMSKPVTKGPVEVVIAGDPNVSLGQIPAGITNPSCQRYRVNDSEATQVTALCSRRWVNVAREEDFIVPWVARAWKLGLMAREFEDNADFAQGDKAYVKAIAALNADLLSSEGEEVIVAAMAPTGFGLDKVHQHR